MKPAPFVHHAPTSVEEAVSLLAEVGHDGSVLAGGQSLVPILNMRLASPGHLVDINRVAGLDVLEVAPGFVRVGALVRHSGLERSSEAYAALPLLREAVRHVAHPAIRNRGTTVGSIAHADPASEMPAVLALSGGVVEVVGPSGPREISWPDFFLGPLETSLAPDELVTAVRFHRMGEGVGTAFRESARRSGDYALAGVAVAVTVTDGVVSGARASFVSVTDVPSVLDLTKALHGVEPASAAWDSALDDVGEAVRAHVEPESDIHASADYRRMLVAELTRRALPDAATSSSAAPPSSSVLNHGFGLPTPAGAGSSRPNQGFSSEGVVVNGVVRSTEGVPARRLLSDFLRHDLELTGTHVGCEHGVCGACTVLVDGQPMRSCLMFAVSAHGHEVTTVEGLTRATDAVTTASGHSMNPVQRAFTECHGLQCGFCTPGFVTTITAWLDDHPEPTADEAREAISGNLCRCTGYQNIVKSVLRAAEIRSQSQPDADDGYAAAPPERHTGSFVPQEDSR